MKIYSNGCNVFSSEEHARESIYGLVEKSRQLCLNSTTFPYYFVGNIQEKVKIEKKGVRHIFYFYTKPFSADEKPSIWSHSYLEREISA
jgi:hypothetical protein